jgi:hypothetical protein
MDDWVILAPTRWSLRRAVRMVNQTLEELRVEQHPDKTFIGRIARGFTFLGYWIMRKGVTGVAPSAAEGFRERLARLYEQNAPQEEISRRIGQYVRRWKRWVLSGVRDVGASDAFMGPAEGPENFSFAAPPSIQASQPLSAQV